MVNCCTPRARFFERKTTNRSNASSHATAMRDTWLSPGRIRTHNRSRARSFRTNGMMVSSTRCCRGYDVRGARQSGRIELLAAGIARTARALLLLAVAGLAAANAFAQGVDVRKPTVTIEDNAFVLDAHFDITLTPTLEDALNKGVPLYFLLEFELIRPRWYWFNDRVVSLHQQYRLQYNALTRQYRLGVGNLYQNYASLPEA